MSAADRLDEREAQLDRIEAQLDRIEAQLAELAAMAARTDAAFATLRHRLAGARGSIPGIVNALRSFGT